MIEQLSIEDRIAGALFGVAVGDALGGTVEFMSRAEIAQTHGVLRDIIGGGVWDLEPGETTDDTAMALAVARGILANPGDPLPFIAEEFVAWFKTDPKDVGNIIRTTLTEGIRRGASTEEEWQIAAKIAHDANGGKSAGNGSLMRTLPVALAYVRRSDREQMRSLARRQSALTHFDPLAGECCAFYCDLIRELLLGKPLHQVLESEVSHAPLPIKLRSPKEKLKVSGFVGDTLETALACAYQTSSFEDALIMAVNLGGDADTIGAVAGGTVGAAYGFAQIPKRWLNQVEEKEEKGELYSLSIAFVQDFFRSN
ncbi:ADP-ribosyl-[dinitrogen reductase] hydrolase [Paradesulfitobacterium aromaticivorans]